MSRFSIAGLLEKDHAELGELVAQLCTALELSDLETSLAKLDLVWARLAVHIRAEHLCLFPAVLEAAGLTASDGSGAPKLAEAQRVIDDLRRDHSVFMRDLGSVMKKIPELRTSGDARTTQEHLRGVRESVIAFRDRLEKHNQTEEQHLYQWPETLLDSTQQLALVEGLRRELGNMPPRFNGALEL